MNNLFFICDSQDNFLCLIVTTCVDWNYYRFLPIGTHTPVVFASKKDAERQLQDYLDGNFDYPYLDDSYRDKNYLQSCKIVEYQARKLV